ncbi:unnamed protein product, partial [Owenia fusiformis]
FSKQFKMATRKTDVCFLILFSFSMISTSHGYIEGLYCGVENCYDVLGVDRESARTEISKAYRKLARKWHPDMHKKKDAKEKAEVEFKRVANAYEILKDEESRKDYDYMLDNPDEFYSHYYRYYKHRVAPKVDVRIVLAVTISVISVIQYWSAWNNYHTAIKYLVTVPKYRLQAQQIAKKEGLLNTQKKRDRSKSKEEIREEEEAVLRNIVAEKMDIKGGYSKPDIYGVLWLLILFSPYYLVMYIYWYARWIWKFTICRQDYGEEEQIYIIRKYMKLSQSQWDAQDESEIEYFLESELWIKENFLEWKQQKEEEMKIKLAENSRHKMYRRYMKMHGPSQMTFGPE